MYMYWVFDKNLSKTACLSNFTTLSMVSRYIFNQSDHKFFNSQSLNCANMLPMWHLHFYTLHFHTPRISSGIQRGLQQQVTRTTSKNIFITLHTLFPSLLTYLGNQPQQYWILYFCFTTNQKKSRFRYFHSGLLFKISMKAFLSASSSHQCNKKE